MAVPAPLHALLLALLLTRSISLPAVAAAGDAACAADGGACTDVEVEAAEAQEVEALRTELLQVKLQPAPYMGHGESTDASASPLPLTNATGANLPTLGAGPRQKASAKQPPAQVRILHLSDTHDLHWTIEANGQRMPPADILLYTGDFTNQGFDKETADFNAWLGTLKGRYPHILVITGNHDWIDPLRQVHLGHKAPEVLLDPNYYKSRITNAQVLEHEEVNVLGLRIFGSAWCPWHHLYTPSVVGPFDGMPEVWQAWSSRGGPPHRYGEIPEGVDLLLTHGPPWGILDHIHSGPWGSSVELLQAVQRVKPKAHLFGHVHEQRGLWQRQANGTFDGGVFYEAKPGERYPTGGAPFPDYPGDVVSNNAMKNQPELEEGHPVRIAGSARLLIATWAGDQWHITAA